MAPAMSDAAYDMAEVTRVLRAESTYIGVYPTTQAGQGAKGKRGGYGGGGVPLSAERVRYEGTNRAVK